TGTNLDTAAAWVTEPNDASTITQGDPIVQTATELQIPFTVDVSDPTETVTLVVDFVDGGCANEVPTQIQIKAHCVPTITSITPSTWFAGNTYDNVVIKGTNFITSAKATATCPVTQVTATTPDGSAVTVSNVNVVDKTKITATISPDANTTTEQATVTAANGSGTGSYSGQPPAQILGNEIHCDASMGCTQEVISKTDGSDPPVQNVVVGQQIHLTTNPNLPGNITPYKTIWTVGGTNIGDYPNSTDGASVADTTLDQADITFYWDYPKDDPIQVKYKYCATIPGAGNQCSESARAAFKVTGPTGGEMKVMAYNRVQIGNFGPCVIKGMTYPATVQLVYGSLTKGTCLSRTGGLPGITFYPPTGYSSDSDGLYTLIQLINSDVTSGDYNESFVDLLDTSDPYAAFLGQINDSPSVILHPGYRNIQRTMTATSFLMWQPPPPSIPVPLGYQQWTFSGSANCESSCDLATQWTAHTNLPTGKLGGFKKSEPSQTSVDNVTLQYGILTWNGATSD
ncbi:MAG: hypothetical protein ABR905_00755, partial [Terracidiphilus sp.]